jgi:hypothetical protein
LDFKFGKFGGKSVRLKRLEAYPLDILVHFIHYDKQLGIIKIQEITLIPHPFYLRAG